MSFECKKCRKDFKRGFYILEGGWAFMEICKDCKETYPIETVFSKLESAEDMLRA